MPDRDVKTIRDLIYYQYSKIIAKSVFGEFSKKSDYGFIKSTFRDLKSGAKQWSEITREDKQFIQSEKACIYCGSTYDLQWEHIVPRSIRIKDACAPCERILGIHNQVWACKQCNLKKRTYGLYSFYKELYPNDRKFYDRIPSLLEKKYLKTIFYCHECSNTLDSFDINLDGEISVLDIDFIIRRAAFA
jgi:hypothetical protein